MFVRLNNITINCMLAALLSALFASCDDLEEFEEKSYVPSLKKETISFIADQDGFQKPTTRGTVDGVTVGLDSIFVLSMKHIPGNDNNWEPVFKDKSGNDIQVLTLKNEGSLIWNYSPLEGWKDSYDYRFRAFYPKSIPTVQNSGESCEGVFTNTSFVNGSTQLVLKNYVSASDPRNNTDLLVSDTINRLYSSDRNTDPVALKMKHILANVCFNIKKKQGQKLTITGFKVVDVIKKGTCTIEGNGTKPNWNLETKEYDNKTYNMDVATDMFDFFGSDGKLLNDPNEKDITKIWGLFKKENNVQVVLKTDNTASGNGGDVFESSLATSENYITDLLFIPQPLNGAEETVNIVMKNETKAYKIKHDVAVNMDFYFDNNSQNVMHATVDLSANGKINEWEAGKRYVYTINVFEYQTTASIFIEDWTHHTNEEELQ